MFKKKKKRVNLKPRISHFSPFVYETLRLQIREEETTRVHKHTEMKTNLIY